MIADGHYTCSIYIVVSVSMQVLSYTHQHPPHPSPPTPSRVCVSMHGYGSELSRCSLDDAG